MLFAIGRLVVIEVVSTVAGNIIYNKYKKECDAGIQKVKGVYTDIKKEVKKHIKK